MSKLIFTKHAKERALERMLGRTGPFEPYELEDVEQLVRANMVRHPFKEVWALPDFDLELVVKDDLVVTIKTPAKAYFDYDHPNMKKMRRRK